MIRVQASRVVPFGARGAVLSEIIVTDGDGCVRGGIQVANF